MDDKFKAGDRVEYRSDRRYKGVVMSVTSQESGRNPLMAIQWDDQEVRTPRKYSPEDLIKLQTNGYDQQDIADIEKDLIELIEEHGPNVWIRNKHSGETGVGIRIGDGLVKVWRHGEVNWPVRLCEVVSQVAARMMGLRDLNTIGKGMWPEAIVPIQPCHMDKERKLAFAAGDSVLHKERKLFGKVLESRWGSIDDGIECERVRVDWDGLFPQWYSADDLDKISNEKELNLGGREVKAISKKLKGEWKFEAAKEVEAECHLTDEQVEQITAEARQKLAKWPWPVMPPLGDLVKVLPMNAPTGLVFDRDISYCSVGGLGRTAKERGYKDGTTIPKSKRPPTYRRTIPGDDGTRGEW